jgi:Ca2+-binding RTX toxin-like protein
MLKLKPVIVFRIVLLVFFVMMVASVASAFTAANTIAPSNIGFRSISVHANDLKPAACAGLDLTNVIHGSGTITGTSGNDLIFGSSGDDIIDGLSGDDCIVGGGGNDIIDGNDGNDICIGGGGNVTFLNCETTLP